MSELHAEIWTTADELSANAAAWNDLCRRSETPLPSLRAEPLSDWLEIFAPESSLKIAVVNRRDSLVAAVPVIERTVGGIFTYAALPNNAWASCGDVLVDPRSNVAAAMDSLCGAISRINRPMFRLEYLPLRTARLSAFIAALQNRGFHVDQGRGERFGLIHLGGSLKDYQTSLSRKHRRHMRNALRRAEQEGEVRLRFLPGLKPEEVDPLIDECFRIEDRSWKGRAGSSLARSADAAKFFRRLPRRLAEWGELDVAFLELNGAPISFQFGATAGGVYHTLKIGYDETHARLTPGQLLWSMLLERFFCDGRRRLVDTVGPLNDALAKWSTGHYEVGKVTVFADTLFGRAVHAAFSSAATCIRGLRSAASPDRRKDASSPPREQTLDERDPSEPVGVNCHTARGRN